MIRKDSVAAILGGILFAAALGIAPAGCDTVSVKNPDYSLLNPDDYQTAAERISAHNAAQAEAEIEYLKQYEQVDYDFFNGDAEAYRH